MPRPFTILLVLCVVSAFGFPSYSNWFRPNLGILFVPVSYPSRAVASWMAGRVTGPEPRTDTRPIDAVDAENRDLRAAYARLEHEATGLRKIAAEWAIVPLRDRCTVVRVVGPGADLGTRDTLVLQSGSFSGLQDGQFALVRQNVVGVIAAGKVGSQLRLVTDPQTKVRAYFASYHEKSRSATQPDEPGGTSYVKLNLPAKLVEGAGGGKMVCRNLPYADAVDREGLAIGDLVLVDDPDWPKDLQGWKLGTVSEIRKTNRMMAEIEIKPEGDLLKLREVMVLTKEH